MFGARLKTQISLVYFGGSVGRPEEPKIRDHRTGSIRSQVDVAILYGSKLTDY